MTAKCLALIAAVMPILCAPASSADKYQFTIVARGGDVADGRTVLLDGVGLSPFGIAVNDSGTIVFRAAFCNAGQPCVCSNSTGCNYGLFTATPGAGLSPVHFVVGTGSVVDGKSLRYLGRPDINNSGTIVYYAEYGIGGSGIFTPSQTLALAGSTISGKTLQVVVPDPRINDYGAVVFSARFPNGGVTSTGIFSPTQLLVSPGTSIGGVVTTFMTHPVLTNSFRLVFTGEYMENGQVVRAIFTPYEKLVNDDLAARIPIVVNEFNASDRGDVVVTSASTLPGVYELNEAGQRNKTKLVAGGGKPVDGYPMLGAGMPAINSSGTIVFWMAIGANGSTNSDGIFTRNERIIGTGDVLAGKTVSRVSYSGALNNLGRIAFVVRFTDNTMAVVVADPRH